MFVPETISTLALTLDYLSGRNTAVGINHKHYCHLLTVMNSFDAYTSRSLSSNHIPNVLALSAFCGSCVAQMKSSPLYFVCSICHLNIVSFVKFQVKLISFGGMSKR